MGDFQNNGDRRKVMYEAGGRFASGGEEHPYQFPVDCQIIDPNTHQHNPADGIDQPRPQSKLAGYPALCRAGEQGE